jgi:hypothetical protein
MSMAFAMGLVLAFARARSLAAQPDPAWRTAAA